MEPRFEPLSSTSGLTILDPIEKRRFSLLTPAPVSPTPASPDDFYFPVSVARSIHTDEIELPYTISVYVRDEEGAMLTDVEPPADISLPRDRYLVELSSPVKLYLRVESEIEIRADTTTVFTADFTPVQRGPNGYILKPVADATLRGHPPRIERGDELAIPEEFARPDTGVTIEVPPEYAKLYPVAPLAFYLGAELVPGDVPCLRTDTGFEHRLDSHRGFEREVERVLKQTFFLDCVVRTEGYYPIELAERNAVEPHLHFDLADLYDRPLAERVATYLEVPYATIEDEVPTWHRVTFVRPEAEHVELLPYVINDLSLVRTPPCEKPVATGDEGNELWEHIDDFRRSPPERDRAVFRGAAAAGSEEFTRSERNDRNFPDRDYVSIPETEPIETAWIGEGVPTSGTKLLKEAYEHDRAAPDDGVIDVTVVCNDSRMRREWDMVSEIYGNRDDIAIEADMEFGVGKDHLRELLKEPTDLFHYIGHVDNRGFDCVDGFLDSRVLDEIGMKAFLLNACHSLTQGEALIEAGSSAGIVSLSEVGNRSAVETGKMLAKLFHHGFSIGTAINLVRRYMTIGSNYVGLGDVGMMLTQNEDNNSLFYEVVDEEDEQLRVAVHCYPNRVYRIGSFINPFITGNRVRNLQPLKKENVISKKKFEERIDGDMIPVVSDQGIIWSDEWG
ncbi:hypothetical protein BRD15_05250 [Halobacteriales archaeon SW_6_65_15]|nr:MAG: hypothetical protein BRD15_05250 [Halobacteriales archaeon SW_6_65_15]